MIDTRRTWQRGAWLVLAMAGALLQGCSEAPKPEAARQGPRLYAADVNGGARVCDAPKLTPVTPLKLVPVMVTTVPPARGPADGVAPLIVGAGT